MSAVLAWFRNLAIGLRILVATVVVVVLAVALWGLWLITGPGPTAFAGGPRVALADYHGADPTGVPASLRNASLVERGKYLAEAADCTVCHTAKGGTPYAGGFAFTLPFGTIFSTNITADKETGIGNYTDQDFLNSLHRGIRKDGARLYPAMPYTSYTYMTDADALAIKAYLFSLAPVRASAERNTLSFPFNQRWLMGMWDMVFNENRRFEPDTSKSAQWNRGAYLAEALAHCGECHTPRNLAYGLNNRRKFAGAVTAGWHAYNITNDTMSGVGAWPDAELAEYLSTGHVLGHGTASGPMGEAVDKSFSRMPREDIAALVTYLRSVPPLRSHDVPARLAPPAPDSPRAAVAANDAQGKHVFEGACASCHGWSGISPIIPNATLTGARAVNDPSAVNVAAVVISGAKRGTAGGSVVMPAFGSTYSDEEIAAVANYVTARFGSKGSRITPGDVADLRRQIAQPE